MTSEEVRKDQRAGAGGLIRAGCNELLTFRVGVMTFVVRFIPVQA